MKKILAVLLSVVLMLLMSGCHVLLGGSILQSAGVDFNSRIQDMENCLAIELGDLNDDSIKTVCSELDPQGNSLDIKYISFDNEAETIELSLSKSEHWNKLPYDNAINDIFTKTNAEEYCEFSEIEEGFYVISGVQMNGDFYDFDRNNIELWQIIEIGIWDSTEDILYFISITKALE